MKISEIMYAWALYRVEWILQQDDRYRVGDGLFSTLRLFDTVIGPHMLRECGIPLLKAWKVREKIKRAVVKVPGSPRCRHMLQPSDPDYDKYYVNDWELARIRLKLWLQIFCMRNARPLPTHLRKGLAYMGRLEHPLLPGAFEDVLDAPEGGPTVQEFLEQLENWHQGHDIAKATIDDGGHYASNINWETRLTNLAKSTETSAEASAREARGMATQYRRAMRALKLYRRLQLQDPESAESRCYRYCEEMFERLTSQADPALFFRPVPDPDVPEANPRLQQVTEPTGNVIPLRRR